MVNPWHYLLTPTQQREILGLRYEGVFLADALCRGFAHENQLGKIELQPIKQTEAQFKGALFEAWLVRKLVEVPAVGLAAFRWATNRLRCQSATYRKFTPFATASTTIKNNFLTSSLYAPSDNHDIKFYAIRSTRYGDIPVLASYDVQGSAYMGELFSLPAGIQVKAITGNEMSEIIDPLLSFKYQSVVTLLEIERDYHSIQECYRIIAWLHSRREISDVQTAFLYERIKSPQMLGLSQQEVNDYSQYAGLVWQEQRNKGSVSIESLDPNAKNAFAAEIGTQTTGVPGIILPNREIYVPQEPQIHIPSGLPPQIEQPFNQLGSLLSPQQ